jgi:hypothetical protein
MAQMEITVQIEIDVHENSYRWYNNGANEITVYKTVN